MKYKFILITILFFSFSLAHAQKNGKSYYYYDFVDNDKTPTQSLQAMFDAVDTSCYKSMPRVTYYLEGANIVLDTTVFYNKSFGRITTIEGGGARIEAPIDATYNLLVPRQGFGYKIGKGGPEDIMTYFDALRVYDVDFVYGGNQLLIVGTYQSVVEGCRFIKGQRGLQAVFCLQGNVNFCEFQMLKFEGCVVRTGLSDTGTIEKLGGIPTMYDEAYFSNASAQNSQSNRFTFESCRWLGDRDQKIGVRISGCDGVRINNAIFEGGHMTYPVYNDSRLSTTVKSFTLDYPHFELGKPGITKALIYNRGCLLEIYGLFQQGAAGVVKIEAHQSKVVLKQIRYIVVGPNSMKSVQSNQWEFEYEGKLKELSDITTWVDGEMPKQLKHSAFGGTTWLGKYQGGTYATWGGGQIRLGSYGDKISYVDMTVAPGNSSQLKHSFSTIFDNANTAVSRGTNLYSLGAVKAKDENGEYVWFYPLYQKKEK